MGPLLFSCPVMFCSLQPHRLQHARPPCPSHHLLKFAQVHVHWWYHPAISPSDALFSLCPQSFPASGLSQLFTSDDQNAGTSASASVVPTSIRVDFSEDWLVWSPCFLQHRSLKASILWCSAFFTVQLSHPYMTPRKTIPLTILPFVVSAFQHTV